MFFDNPRHCCLCGSDRKIWVSRLPPHELLLRYLEAPQSRVAEPVSELRVLQIQRQIKAVGVKGRKPQKPLSWTDEHDG
jgi:hypothetical protein